MLTATCRLILLLLLVPLGAGSARAQSFQFSDDPMSGLDPTKVTLPKKEGTLLNIRGEAKVDGNNGALTFDISLPIPEWRKLLKGLGLRYDSQAGASVYGYGFDLTLPKITRSRQFGVPHSETPLTSSLDGELLPVNQNSVKEPGQFLRARIEGSFRLYRIDGPRIVMADGDGNNYEFGGSAAAREESDGYTATWHLTSISDPSGNRVVIGYHPQDGLNVAIPKTISLVERDGTVPYVTTLSIEGRPDTWTSHRSGLAQTFSQRVNSIACYWNKESLSLDDLMQASPQQLTSLPRVFRFALEYVSPDQSGVSKRSLLARIARYGATDDDKTPATTFKYSSDDLTPADTTGSIRVPGGPAFMPMNAKFLDFNGDGLVDILGMKSASHSWHVWYNLGGNAGFSEPKLLPIQALSLDLTNHVLLDVDGDRRIDLLYQDQVYLNDPKSGVWAAEPVPVNGLSRQAPGDTKAGIFLDIDGDGRVDYVEYATAPRKTRLRVYPNQSHDGTIVFGAPYVANSTIPSLELSRITWGDFNGDGLPDMANMYGGLAFNSRIHLAVWFNTGRGFAEQVVLDLDKRPFLDQYRAVDFNADGLADLVFARSGSLEIFLGTGQGFVRWGQSFARSFYGKATLIDLGNITGSGATSLIVGGLSDSLGYYDPYAKSAVKVPFLMIEQATELGEQNSYDYLPTTATYSPDNIMERMPIARQILTQWRQTAPTVKNLGTWGQHPTHLEAYRYARGGYDHERNEFLGYAWSERRVAHGAADTSSASDNPYTQGVATVSEYYTTEEGGRLKGKLRRQEQRRLSDGLVFETRESPWILHQLYADRDIHWPLQVSSRVTHRESDGTQRTQTSQTCTRLYLPDMVPGERTEFQFDDAGGVYRRIHTTYVAPGSKWLVRKPAKMELLAGDQGPAVMGKEFTYQAGNCKLRRVDRLLDGQYRRNTQWDYDSSGNVIGVTDALGRRTDLRYESSGPWPTMVVTQPQPGYALTKRYNYDLASGGLVAATVDENEATTSYRYDGLGRLVAVLPPGATEPSHTLSYRWGDGSSPTRIEVRQNGLDGTQTAYHDGLLRHYASLAPAESGVYATTYREYDLAGRVGIEAIPQPVDLDLQGLSADSVRTNTYDELGRVTLVRSPVALGVTGSYDADEVSVPKGSERHTYSALQSRHWDAEGQLREETRDIHGRLHKLTIGDHKEGVVTEITNVLDVADRIVEQQLSGLPSRLYTYDEASRLRAYESTDLGRVEWDYTPTDKPEAERVLSSDGKPVATRLRIYDGLDRETEARSLPGVATNILEGYSAARRDYQYHYDRDAGEQSSGTYRKGRLAALQLFDGARYSYAYDARGNRSVEALKLYGNTLVTSFAYDALDRLTAITYPDGESVDYAYSRTSGSLIAAVPWVKEVRYDDHMRIEAINFKDDVRQEFDYDSQVGVLTAQRAYSSANLAADYRYTQFDALHRVLAMEGSDLSNRSLTRVHRYDARGQLAFARLSAEPTDGSPTATYEGDSVYDAAGNPLQLGGQTVSYERDPGGALRSMAVGANTASFGAFGYLTASDRIQHAGWYGSGRLACTIAREASQTRYSYLPDGNRFAEVKDSDGMQRSTVFINRYASYTKETNAFVKHVFLGNKRVATITGDGKPRYLTEESQGLGQLALGADGKMASHFVTDPWGGRVRDASTQDLRHRYRDALYDGDTQLHQMGTRYYMAGLGRFVSPDMYMLTRPQECAGSPFDCHLHSYARNNPMKYTDPRGQRAGDIWLYHSDHSFGATLSLVGQIVLGNQGPYAHASINLDDTVSFTSSGRNASHLEQNVDILQKSTAPLDESGDRPDGSRTIDIYRSFASKSFEPEAATDYAKSKMSNGHNVYIRNGVCSTETAGAAEAGGLPIDRKNSGWFVTPNELGNDQFWSKVGSYDADRRQSIDYGVAPHSSTSQQEFSNGGEPP